MVWCSSVYIDERAVTKACTGVMEVKGQKGRLIYSSNMI